jgi:hypothetical protein
MFTYQETQATFKARQSSWLKMLMGLNSSTMMVSGSLLPTMMESACSQWDSQHCKALSSDSDRTFKLVAKLRLLMQTLCRLTAVKQRFKSK